MRIGEDGIQMDMAQGSLIIDFGVKVRNELRHECTSRWHSNRWCEVTMVLQGGCRVDVEEDSFDLRAGQAVVIPRDRHHSFTAQPGEFERFCFWFDIRGGRMEEQLGQLTETRVFDMDAQTAHHCRTIYDEYVARTPFWWDMQTTLLKALAITVMRWLKLDDGNHEEQGYKDRPMRATKIERYIESNLTQELDLAGLARHMHLSQRQTMRIVQEEFGMSFREKVVKTRMEQTAWLLRTTGMPVEVILSEVGYRSERGFYQSFRRQFGQTPRKYRAQAARERGGREPAEE